MVKILLKGEVGGHALNSHENYIVDHGKSWNCVFEFFISGYVTDVLDDAKVYSGHAGKKTIDTEDVRLAVQCKMDHSFTTPPPRDVCKFLFCIYSGNVSLKPYCSGKI